jgi:hypothetical protein
VALALTWVSLVRNGWGVLLAFLLPALSLTWLLIDEDTNPLALLAIVAAPVFSLAGLMAAFYFRARTHSPQKKRIGSIDIVVGIGALLFSLIDMDAGMVHCRICELTDSGELDSGELVDRQIRTERKRPQEVRRTTGS